MKVCELIEKVRKFDPYLEVIVDGYEGGFTEAVIVEKRTMVRTQKYNGIYGEFCDPADREIGDRPDMGKAFHAIRIACTDEEHGLFPEDQD